MMKLKGKTIRAFQGPPVEKKKEVRTRVFVYGTLKTGHGNNSILRRNRATFLGEAMTALPIFRLYGDFIPYMVPENTRGVHVKGELWEVNEKCLHELDRLEGHPYMYTRQTIEVLTDEGVSHAEAYVFLHKPMANLRDLGEVYSR